MNVTDSNCQPVGLGADLSWCRRISGRTKSQLTKRIISPSPESSMLQTKRMWRGCFAGNCSSPVHIVETERLWGRRTRYSVQFPVLVLAPTPETSISDQCHSIVIAGCHRNPICRTSHL